MNNDNLNEVAAALGEIDHDNLRGYASTLVVDQGEWRHGLDVCGECVVLEGYSSASFDENDWGEPTGYVPRELVLYPNGLAIDRQMDDKCEGINYRVLSRNSLIDLLKEERYKFLSAQHHAMKLCMDKMRWILSKELSAGITETLSALQGDAEEDE